MQETLTMSAEDLEVAKELFAHIIKEHLDDKRCVTTLTVTKLEDRLRIFESEECSCSI